jgi:hypothetical protein
MKPRINGRRRRVPPLPEVSRTTIQLQTDLLAFARDRARRGHWGNFSAYVRWLIEGDQERELAK